MRRRQVPLAVAVAVALAAPPAGARDLGDEGLNDPRKRELPARHRLRLGVAADWVRATQACDDKPMRCQRFHFAPLVLDIAYQLQFLKWAMFRPSLGIGYNVANSRNAMPALLKLGLHAGYQGRMVGAAIGWSFLFPFPATANQTDGHGGLAQPALWGNHALQAELSFTSRIDRGALNFGVRVGVMRTHLIHLNLDFEKWYPIVSFNLGWFFDLGAEARRRRAEQRRAQQP